MTTAEKYVTGAYLVLLGMLLVYLLIIALKVSRLEAGARGPDAGRAGEARWLSCSSGRRLLAYGEAAVAYAGDARRPGSMGRLGDLGRAHRVARADGAPRRAGGARGRLSVGHVGRIAQPLRLARRRCVSDLGLQAAVQAARARRDAAGRAAAGDLVRRGRRGRFGPERLLVAVPGRSRRARPGRVRGPDARRRARRALSLAGAGAEAAQLDGAAVPRALARHPRVAVRPHGRLLAAGAHARDGRRVRAPAPRLAARPSDRAHGADVGRVRRVSRAALRSGLARPARRVHDAGRLRAGRRACSSACTWGISHEPRPRRHVAPPVSRRGARARRLRSRGSRGARAQDGPQRRGGVPLDLQPHRALPRGLGSRGGRGARVGGIARRRGRALPHDRRGCGAAPVPGRGRPRLARSGRGRDPRPGARRVRGGRARPGARPVVPRGASRGQEGADGDGDQREPRVGLVRGCGAGPAGVRRPDGLPRAARRRRRGERARRPGARCARRDDRRRDEPDAGERGAGWPRRSTRARFRSTGSDRSSTRRTSSSPRRARPNRSCPGTRCPTGRGARCS